VLNTLNIKLTVSYLDALQFIHSEIHMSLSSFTEYSLQ
jgi:hypothetical protein